MVCPSPSACKGYICWLNHPETTGVKTHAIYLWKALHNGLLLHYMFTDTDIPWNSIPWSVACHVSFTCFCFVLLGQPSPFLRKAAPTPLSKYGVEPDLQATVGEVFHPISEQLQGHKCFQRSLSLGSYPWWKQDMVPHSSYRWQLGTRSWSIPLASSVLV